MNNKTNKTLVEIPKTMLMYISGGAGKPKPPPEPKPNPKPVPKPDPLDYSPWPDL